MPQISRVPEAFSGCTDAEGVRRRPSPDSERLRRLVVVGESTEAKGEATKLKSADKSLREVLADRLKPAWLFGAMSQPVGTKCHTEVLGQGQKFEGLVVRRRGLEEAVQITTEGKYPSCNFARLGYVWYTWSEGWQNRRSISKI